MRRVLRLIAIVREAASANGETAVVTDTTPAGPGTLDIATLAAIEAELGTELHDDVLIVLAAGIPMLTTATCIEIDYILDRLGEADVPAGWVSIGRHRDEHEDLCVPVPARAESVIAPSVLVDDHAFDAPLAFPRWVEEKLRGELETRSDWLELLVRLDTITELPVFALTGRVPEVPPPVTRRVVHDKFGTGTVVRELDGGTKLVIAFADAERTLLARFVRDI
jgi:hypothetical protein